MVRLNEKELSRAIGPVLRNFPMATLLSGVVVILARVDGDEPLPLLDGDRHALTEVLYRELLTRRLDRIDTMQLCDVGHLRCSLRRHGPCGKRILAVMDRRYS